MWNNLLLLLKYHVMSVGFYLISGILIYVAAAPPSIVTEYQLKAVYLFNFTKFIKWPETSFDNDNSPYSICVLGEDPFQEKLDLAVQNETVHKRSVTVQRLKTGSTAKIKSCHILFISRSEQKSLNDILAQLHQAPILTVSDMDDFVSQGGMIGFYLLKNTKVRFSIDPQTLSETGLVASAQLLQIANITRR